MAQEAEDQVLVVQGNTHRKASSQDHAQFSHGKWRENHQLRRHLDIK